MPLSATFSTKLKIQKNLHKKNELLSSFLVNLANNSTSLLPNMIKTLDHFKLNDRLYAKPNV